MSPSPDPIELWCAPHIRMARLDEDIIVLNILEDRYDGLLAAAGHISIPARGRLLARDANVAHDLLGAGLATLEPPPSPAPPAAPIVPPARELESVAPASRLDAWRAALVLTTAALAFRRLTFARLLDDRPPPTSARPVDHPQLARLLAAARAARIWIPFEGQCLKRSFQLRRFLADNGIATDWVFGVRTWPFGAHCWLQVNDLVIGDRLERVARYTPILRA